jgi:UDP-N-acetylmuramoylalanine--D-glutamate ligase
MTAADLNGANVTVVGLGKSGLAALALLRTHGARLAAVDAKPLAELAGAAARLEELGAVFRPQSPDAFADSGLIVLSPGVPVDLPELTLARARGVPLIGEVELAGLFLKGPSIGITGSNGKTTTTALTGHILSGAGIPAQVGGNIGNPPANMVDSSRDDQWNVLELSSFQLETIRHFRVTVGAVLNVTPDHLDRHHTMAAYVAAKRRIFETQRPGDRAILNADDPVCREYAACVRSSPVWFSMSIRPASGFWRDGRQIVCDDGPVLNAAEIPLRGAHNVENVMAAAAAARLAGAPLEAIAIGVRTFPGVEHRLEFVRTLDGVAWYNDSKATNVDAALKAVNAFSGGLWIILGGKDKGSDYRPLASALRDRAHAALLIGAAAEKIAGHLGDSVETIPCGDLATAVAEAHRRARPGDVVLLAPACASFDQFTSFEHRGRLFKDLVESLVETGRREDSRCA